jgi:Ca-activated chloride channel family protein
MRRRSNLAAYSLFAGVAFLLAPAFVWGQAQEPKPAAQEQEQDAVFSSDTRLVPLNVTVTDKNGHLVTGLPQSAFTVMENGAPQQIKIFRNEDVPVSIGLIIDNSGSMREKRQAVESAALTLIKSSNPQDEAFVVNFNDEAYLDTPDLTGDLKILEAALTKINAKGGTAMRDALRMSIEELKKKAKRDKKVLLVVTDGNDNASTETLEAVIRDAQQNDVLVYGIGLLSQEERKEARAAKRALDLLVTSTGGQVFYPNAVTEVEQIAQEVARDIRSQYTIAYTPSNSALDGTFRQIKVAVKSRTPATARTRMGYYATKERGGKK